MRTSYAEPCTPGVQPIARASGFAGRRVLAPLLIVALAAARPCGAQEDVVHRRQGIIVRGRILSYDATGVRIEYGSTKEPKFIPIEEIERVEVKLSPEQEQGEKLYREGAYREAVQKLSGALQAEMRGWLRARIQSQIIAAQVALGESVGAIETFVAASQEGTSQLGWGVVPLWWLPEPPAAAARQYGDTLVRSDDPLRVLIGASLLLGTERSSAAREALRRLATHPDERVGQLARTQLWRAELEDADAEKVAAWQRQLDRLPADARGGPHLVIGLALARLEQHDLAALEFLWPALVFRADPRLSARAMLLAARSLERADRLEEARRLYQDLAHEFPRSVEAAEAGGRLRETQE